MYDTPVILRCTKPLTIPRSDIDVYGTKVIIFLMSGCTRSWNLHVQLHGVHPKYIVPNMAEHVAGWHHLNIISNIYELLHSTALQNSIFHIHNYIHMNVCIFLPWQRKVILSARVTAASIFYHQTSRHLFQIWSFYISSFRLQRNWSHCPSPFPSTLPLPFVASLVLPETKQTEIRDTWIVLQLTCCCIDRNVLRRKAK